MEKGFAPISACPATRRSPHEEPGLSLYSISGLALYAVIIFGFSATVTALILRHFRIIDVPNERSSHSAPTPRGGGVGIVLSFFVALALIHFFGGAAAATPLLTLPFAGFLAALLLIAAISLHDDIAGRGFASKLLAQLVAIAILMTCGGVADLGPFGLSAGDTAIWLAWLLTLVWMVGLTNAYNFMDGLDGMAGGTAAIAAAFFALICGQQELPFIAMAALAISAGSCGFLLFNWPPAKIFMGDIGSTFLGFAFAALAVLAANGAAGTTPHMALIMPLLLLHYLYDTIFTFCRRLLAGENVVRAHRTHLYQLLNRSGHSHRRVSLIYAGMAMLQGIGALWLSAAPNDSTRLWIFLPFLIGHTLYAARVIRRARHLGLI